MRSRAELVVGAPAGAGGRYRIEKMRHAPPFALRPTPDAIYLVGSAAAPVGSDDLAIDLTVRSGAEVTVRSAAAMVVWAGDGTRHHVSAKVADHARLDWRPEPVIVTRGARHHQSATIELSGSAKLRWREILVLGRHGEEAGRVESTLDVTRDGVGLFRHTLAVGADRPAWAGPAILGPARVVALELVVGDEADDIDRQCGPGWAAMALGGGAATVILAVGETVTSVSARLVEACHTDGRINLDIAKHARVR